MAATYLITSRAEVPAEVYESTLIIGATNVPNVLDITQVQPGTLIVDDSGPHCFDPELAIQRLQQQEDILFRGCRKTPSHHEVRQVRLIK